MTALSGWTRYRATSAVCVMAAAISLVPVGSSAQQAPAPSPPPAATETPAPPAPQAPASKPGLLDAINKWFDKSASDLKSTFDKTNKVAKDAAESLTKLPGTRVVEERERCATAANGSPDCVASAEAICKRKGFASGKSLETQSTQKCPPRVWLSGRAPADGECSVETYVIKSVCQ